MSRAALRPGVNTARLGDANEFDMADGVLSVLLNPIYCRLQDIAVPVGNAGSEYILFFSYTDGRARARVETFRGQMLADAWRRGTSRLRKVVTRNPDAIRWLRIDIVDEMRQNDWGTLKRQLIQVKRNYCRQGISLDPNCRHAFLETEINANAMFYGGPRLPHCVVNEKNFERYARRRHGLASVDFGDETPVWMFSSRGFFIDKDMPNAVHEIVGSGRSAGRRIVEPLDEGILSALIESSSTFLTGQVGDDGRFIYGWHPCFDREIQAYNCLRHASTTYAMIEAWEVTQDSALMAAIERSLAWLCREAIRTMRLPDGTEAAFLVDVGDEIKLGANAVAILAFTRHAEVTGRCDHLPLLEKLALGIQHMQRSRDGSFVHVLNYPDLTRKEAFRTIYYEGEAAFGLMRLYKLTRDERWLQTVEKAFEYFIAKEHWKHNDHWLSYCVNELTLYRPDERYFRFGIQNVRDYLDFVLNRITTFPTLLELMMAAQAMLDRIETIPEMRHLLDEIDRPKFQRALHFRARYLLNGYFWPELAMFFANPNRIVGSFFIRHHAFRVRIDDVEHYLSGLVAYRNRIIRLRDEGRTMLSDAGPRDCGEGEKRPINEIGESHPCRTDWTAGEMESLTRGRWLVAPDAKAWKANGICADPGQFASGQMVLAPTGAAGLRPASLARLAPRSMGIIAEVGSDYPGLGVPVLEVPDLRDAVTDLATAARATFSGTMVAVTGSVGKTTTTAMAAHALSGIAQCDRSRTSANSFYGIGWNLASMRRDAQFWVQEMAVQRMEACSKLVMPDVAIVTAIAPAHMEYFKTIENIARLKARIYLGMKPGKIAVINHDIPQFSIIRDAACAAQLRVVSFGSREGSHARLLASEAGVIDAIVGGRRLSFQLGAPGRHMAMNALAVLAAVSALDLDLDAAASQFVSFAPLTGRGKRSASIFAGKQIEIWDEAYNANPASMRAAIKMMQDPSISVGSRVLVLGDMLELGPDEQQMHLDLEDEIQAVKPDRVLFCGPLMKALSSRILRKINGDWFPDVISMQQSMDSWVRNGDVLLVKASNGTGLGRIVKMLQG